jgi:predicted negative regulator of RcsB-dependent stress response
MNGKTLFWVVIILAVISAMFGSNSSSTTSSSHSNSKEYNYVKQRIKMEGYNDKEAAQAADAIIKFHNAQKNGR